MRRQHLLALDSDGAMPAARSAPGAVAGWNDAALRALEADGAGPAAAARTLALLHTAMYNAWAACDDAARQTAHGVAVRLPRARRGPAAKAAALHHAAHALLRGCLPAQRSLFDARMAALGLDGAGPAEPLSPGGIGRVQAAAMLDLGNEDAHADDAPLAPLAHWCRLARQLALRDGHDEDRDVRLFFALANALADGAAAGGRSLLRGQWLPERTPGQDVLGAAAAEVWRRFTGTGAPDANRRQDAGREIGALVFEKARRHWQGRL